MFRKKGIEVLLLTDRVDEWLMGHLAEFDGKKLQDVGRGELDLGALEDESEKQEKEKLAEQHKALLERAQKVLEGKVEAVRVTNRLTDSPACIVLDEHDMGLAMQRLMKQAGHEVPASKPVLEINPAHALVKRLETDSAHAADLALLLLDQAQLLEGVALEDPAAYVRRVNALLTA